MPVLSLWIRGESASRFSVPSAPSALKLFPPALDTPALSINDPIRLSTFGSPIATTRGPYDQTIRPSHRQENHLGKP